MLIWVTRTAPGNFRTAKSLRALGHRSLIAPALTVRKIEPEPPDGPVEAIVFTSANGVRLHNAREIDLDTPVFAVGNHTADVATAAGYKTVLSANGDVNALLHILRGALPAGAKVAHYCAEETAGDLGAELAKFGLQLDRRVVYQARPVTGRQLSGVKAALANVDGIMVHSGKAAERTRRVILGSGWRGRVWCISRACAQHFRGIPGLVISSASVPTEEAMLACIPATSPKRGVARGKSSNNQSMIKILSTGERRFGANDNFLAEFDRSSRAAGRYESSYNAPSSDDQDFAATFASFAHEVRRFQQFSEEAAAAVGLKPQQHQALLSISGSSDRRMSVSALADHLVLKSHTVSKLVDGLESLQFVRRVPDEKDGRVVMISLTGKAEELMASLSAAHRAELRHIRGPLVDLLESF